MKLLTFIILAFPLILQGCIDDSDDDDDNPDDDSIWSVMPDEGGLRTGYSLFDSTTSITNLTSGNTLPKCDALDTDGDGTNDASMRTQLSFTPNTGQGSGSGSFALAVTLADTTCSGAADYSDEATFSYIGYSSSFDFNRMDFTVTAIGRQVNTTAGMEALNTASACSVDNWTMDADTLQDVSTCTSTEVGNLSGYNVTAGNSVLTVGTNLEGIFIVGGDLLSISIGAEDARPSATVDTSNNDFWVINSADLYYRY